MSETTRAMLPTSARNFPIVIEIVDFEPEIIDLTSPMINDFIISIDVGLKNLAIAYYEMNSGKFTSIGLHKLAETTSQTFEIAEAAGRWAKNVIKELSGKGTVACVLIERQFQFNNLQRVGYSQASKWNMCIESSLHGAFTAMGVKIASISPRSVASKFDLNKRGIDRNTKKKLSVQIVKDLMEKNVGSSRVAVLFSESVVHDFHKYQKKDDIADSILQLVYYINL